MCLKTVTETKEGIVLAIKRTKTLQFKDGILQIPVPRLHHSLCPVTALAHMLEKLDMTDPVSPLFAYRDRQHKVRVMTHSIFVKLPKAMHPVFLWLPSIGILWPFIPQRCMEPVWPSWPAVLRSYQKLRAGDLKSSAWERHIDIPLQCRWAAARTMANKVLQ